MAFPLMALLVAVTAPTAAAPAPPTAAPTPPVIRAALQETTTIGEVPPRVRRVVSDALLVELRKLAGLSVTSMDEVRALLALEADKQLVGCAEESCLAEIADALGVDLLIMASLTMGPKESVLALRAVNQRDATASNAVSKRLVPAGGDELLAALGPAVAELFPGRPLRQGAVRGVAPEQALRLHRPPLPPWAMGSALAVAGALAVGAGSAFGLAVYGRSQAQALLIASTSRAVAGRDLVTAVALRDAGVVAGLALAGAAVVGLLAAGAMALFTDFAPAEADHGAR